MRLACEKSRFKSLNPIIDHKMAGSTMVESIVPSSFPGTMSDESMYRQSASSSSDLPQSPSSTTNGSSHQLSHQANGNANGNHNHIHPVNAGNSNSGLPNIGELDSRCGGCHEVIDQESGGVVVAFG